MIQINRVLERSVGCTYRHGHNAKTGYMRRVYSKEPINPERSSDALTED